MLQMESFYNPNTCETKAQQNKTYGNLNQSSNILHILTCCWAQVC